jgi:endonuclease YncB( thermonuclease family)
MCRGKPSLLLLVAVLGVLACLPSAAAAAAVPTEGRLGSCGAGVGKPECELWTGKVTFIGDGDTMSVDIAGDGTKSPLRIRITGIQAMEESYYTNVPGDRFGECHANEATARLEGLVKAAKGRVRLAAQDPESTSRGRFRRVVYVKIRGKYRDVGRTLITEGHALALPNRSEWAWNVRYSILAQRAARKGLGIWNPTYCGPGPLGTEFANLRVQVNWDAPGGDANNPNGEYVNIKNFDPVNPLPIAGWWVRDSDLRRYTFPEGAYVPPGDKIQVHVGEGVNSVADYYWGLGKGIFDNAVHNGQGAGDGAYLFDSEGDLRAYMTYPCHEECTDPLQGGARITAAYKRRAEFVEIENLTQAPIDLEGYRIDTPPYGFTFGGDSVVAPGEKMRVNVLGDPADNTRLEKNWGKEGPILGNGGDRVRLQTLTDIVIDCQAWGSASC